MRAGLWGGILRDVGLVLHAPALLAAPLALWAALDGRGLEAAVFALTAVAAAGSGQALYRCFASCEVTARVHALAVAGLAWLGVALLGAIPLLLLGLAAPAGSEMRTFGEPIHALFESMSGFTSTGLTMSARPAALPASILLWRSLSEWLGGIGILVALLAFLNPAADTRALFSAELARGSRESVGDALRRCWWIYGLHTVLGIGLFWALGMTPWEAFNHGLTAISTGGFSVTDRSMAEYGPALRAATLLVMVIGATSFSVQARMLRHGELLRPWRDASTRLFLVLLVLGPGFLVLERGDGSWSGSIYQWVSALTTCGFHSEDVGQWRPAARLALVVAMAIGAASGATAGGLKTDRVVDLMRGLRIRFERLWNERDEEPDYRFGDEMLSPMEAHQRVEAAAVLALLWVTSILVGTLVVRAFAGEQHDIVAVLFDVTSALSGVGLSAGVASADLETGGKAALIALMWLGRLEIIPVLVLLTLPFRPTGQSRPNSGLYT